MDFLLVHGRRRLPIEIRFGAALDPRSLAGLRQCMADLGLRRGVVVTTGGERRPIGPSIEIVPWAEIATGRIDLPL